MSWRDFDWLIQAQISDVTAWMNAIRANPNTPEDALKVALLKMIQREDGEMLERLTRVVIDMVRNADAMLTALREQGGGFLPATDGRFRVTPGPMSLTLPDWEEMLASLPDNMLLEDFLPGDGSHLPDDDFLHSDDLPW